MFRVPVFAFLLVAASTSALAERPPADALPLSEIVRMLEDSGDVDYIKEVDWDDDGYWEIEYVRQGGGDVDVDIDPRTGQVRN